MKVSHNRCSVVLLVLEASPPSTGTTTLQRFFFSSLYLSNFITIKSGLKYSTEFSDSFRIHVVFLFLLGDWFSFAFYFLSFVTRCLSSARWFFSSVLFDPYDNPCNKHNHNWIMGYRRIASSKRFLWSSSTYSLRLHEIYALKCAPISMRWQTYSHTLPHLLYRIVRFPLIT